METIFMKSENSKTSEPHRFRLENIKSEYSNNKFKISAPTWNDAFDLPDDSYSIADI